MKASTPIRRIGRSARLLPAAAILALGTALPGTVTQVAAICSGQEPVVGQVCVERTIGTVNSAIAATGPMEFYAGFPTNLPAGGAVQHAPKVYITYWGWTGDPSGEAPYLESFLGNVGGSSWANILTQYCDNVPPGTTSCQAAATQLGASPHYVTNPAGQLAGTWSDPTSIPGTSSEIDAQLGNEAVKAAAHFGYDSDADYFIATPTGHSSTGFGSSFCAMHGSTPDGAGNRIPFTDLPYLTDAGGACGAHVVNGAAGLLDGVSIIAGHEYAEVITNARLSGSAWHDAQTNEIGDKCQWQNLGNITLADGRAYAVQPLFSNAAGPLGACAMSY